MNLKEGALKTARLGDLDRERRDRLIQRLTTIGLPRASERLPDLDAGTRLIFVKPEATPDRIPLLIYNDHRPAILVTSEPTLLSIRGNRSPEEGPGVYLVPANRRGLAMARLRAASLAAAAVLLLGLGVLLGFDGMPGSDELPGFNGGQLSETSKPDATHGLLSRAGYTAYPDLSSAIRPYAEKIRAFIDKPRKIKRNDELTGLFAAGEDAIRIDSFQKEQSALRKFLNYYALSGPYPPDLALGLFLEGVALDTRYDDDLRDSALYRMKKIYIAAKIPFSFKEWQDHPDELIRSYARNEIRQESRSTSNPEKTP